MRTKTAPPVATLAGRFVYTLPERPAPWLRLPIGRKIGLPFPLL